VNGKGNVKNGNDKGDPMRRPGGGGNPPGQAVKSRAPEQTFEEVRYLKHLIENEIPVRVKLRDNSEVAGTIEYYDSSFIRLTRHDEPNLFVFKHEIKYIYEE
jgi:sRNA-binding regulator protein Hfq